MNITELSEKLKQAGVVKVSKADLFDTITAMAKSIHACPRRNATNRSYEVVFNHCSYIAVEYALAKVIDGERNPKEFNVKDKDSYNWDVKASDKFFEVKRHKTGSKWFTYNGKSIKTYLKNCLNLDYLVTGYLDSTSTDYLIDFALVADSKTFEFYFKPSNYNGYYYDHVTASKLGHCVILNLRNPVY
jgi:hypothetical protein